MKEDAYFLIHEARYKRILEEIDSRLRGNDKARVLDVGCYPYHLGAALEKMGYDVWGISSTHEPIKNKKVSILNIETDPFPYKDATFDLVLFSEVIEHLLHSPLPALTEMHRVAKKGGHILITTPNRHGSINLGKQLVGYTPSYPTDINPYHRHNHEYTLHELTKLVSTAGWNVTRATRFISYHPFRRRNRTDNPLLWLGKFMNYLTMLAVPRLRDTLLVIGGK